VRRAATALLLAALGAAASGCAHTPPGSRPDDGGTAVAADSVTAALWHMDETGGTLVADAGPFRLQGRAGIDTRTDFGRIRGARLFTRSIESFVHVPYNPVLEGGEGGITIEAWIYLNEYGQYEDTPIAARWTQQAGEQSWMLAVLGQDTRPPIARLPSPGYHDGLIGQRAVTGRGKLMFAFQPEDASPPRAFFSARTIDLGKWVHVAATFDGAIVRLWVDGELDAQFASRGGIRDSRADLLIGNYIDPRWLSEFGGELRVTTAPDMNPYYAFDGFIDELRISTTVRQDFAYARNVGSR
jgi:concanavalin A-like lectin/glucanase superfamily protein